MRRKDLHKRTRDLGPNDLTVLAAWVAAKRDAMIRGALITVREGVNGVFQFKIPADIYSVADRQTAIGAPNPLRGVTLQWYEGSAPQPVGNAVASSSDRPVGVCHAATLYASTYDTGYQSGFASRKYGDEHSDKELPTRVTYKCQPGDRENLGHLMLVVTFADATKAPETLSIRFDRHDAPLLELPDP